MENLLLRPKLKNKKVNTLLSVVFGVCLFFFLLTLAIGLPIYCRFFYYWQIKPLNLEKATGYTYAQIKGAYDAVLNFLTLPNFPFSTGDLKYSLEGMAHFYDCKVLFNLNLSVMIISGAITVALAVLSYKRVILLDTKKGLSVEFYSAICAVGLPIIIGALCAINFDKAFEIFHKIFFPGKDNWIFDPSKDEIIKILPEEFFMNCAIFIGVGLIVMAGVCVLVALLKKRNLSKTKIFDLNGEEILIRPIKRKDNIKVKELVISCLGAYPVPKEGSALNDKNLDKFYYLYRGKNKYFVAVNKRGEVLCGAGIYGLDGDNDTCELQKMYCVKSARGTGLSKELLDLCEEFAKKYYSKIYLETFTCLKEAQKFYLKNGYKKIENSMGNTGHFACDVFFIKEL